VALHQSKGVGRAERGYLYLRGVQDRATKYINVELFIVEVAVGITVDAWAST